METLEPKTENLPNFDLSQIPIEITQDFLSRLPAKSLLRFKTVSKPFQSLITDPHFIKLHLNRSTKCPSELFVSLYNISTSELHFVSVSCRGGPITRLLTLPGTPAEPSEAEHLNGLVLFRSQNGFVRHNFAYVFNPSTRQIFKLPGKASIPRYTYGNAHVCYFFGYDEGMDEFKVLNIRMVGLRSYRPTVVECAIFSLSSYVWRNLDLEFPFNIQGEEWLFGHKNSICVGSVIFVMLNHKNELLAFDLREERFRILHIPGDALPHEFATNYNDNGQMTLKLNHPHLIKFNGKLGLICHDHVVDRNIMDVWVLEDYQNQVWVKDTITFRSSWLNMNSPFPSDTIQTGEVLFTPQKSSLDVISIPFYDMKAKSFGVAEVNLVGEDLCSDDVEVRQVRSYVNHIMPLRTNETRS